MPGRERLPELPKTMSDEEHAARVAAWEAALYEGSVPDFVSDRLQEAASGRSAWVSTMTPAELLIAKTHGVRPIATVSGNCWMKITFGAQLFGLAQGHAEGWQTALARVEQEAIAAGASAVVDLRLTSEGRHSGLGGVEFSVIGTAVKIAGMAEPKRPVLASVPALEFVRMVDSGVVPTGVAIGVSCDMIGGYGAWGGYGGGYGGGFGSRYGGWANWGASQRIGWQAQSWFNQPITELTDFWERIRREAISDLHRAASARGNGVLAHSQKSRLIRIEQDKQPPAWVGEHIVIGTTVDASAYRKLTFEIEPVIDLRDSSPLGTSRSLGNVYPQTEKAIDL
jgi:uncharacterized protein YbjQ (UPF0145 family)